ncbi:hypothetical protein J3R82DRAFT_7821 [Butyriboletus roseoflavus]|nr:hypothetical protein J3R82DRAFT_7821 [Butyriboletus roseoflavus]
MYASFVIGNESVGGCWQGRCPCDSIPPNKQPHYVSTPRAASKGGGPLSSSLPPTAWSGMFDQVIGTCCALAVTACLDVLTGICTDFSSTREYHLAPVDGPDGDSGSVPEHACTETLCRCSCPGCQRYVPLDDPQEERDPLLSNTQQPSSHPPMRSHSH